MVTSTTAGKHLRSDLGTRRIFRFKITARSNRLFGEWASARLGLLGERGDDYASSVVHAQFEEPGVVTKVGIDLRAKGIVATDDELRSELARFTEEAERQIMAE